MGKDKRRTKEHISGICPLCKQVWDGFNYDPKRREKDAEIKDRNIKKMVAERLKAFRIEKQITQERLAEILGVNRTSIGHIESGHINVSISYLYKIADVLDKSIHDFLDD